MRAIDIPPILWSPPDGVVPSRPWWAITQHRATQQVRFVRIDGQHYDALSPDIAAVEPALARIDVRHPLPPPPPMPLQVWAWFDGSTFALRAIIAMQGTIKGDQVSLNVLWSDDGAPSNVWPPPGGQLVHGPHAPWSPVHGISLSQLLGQQAEGEV